MNESQTPTWRYADRAAVTERDGAAKALFEPLTRRERDTLRLLAEGYTGPEIAAQLVLALSTVKSYMQHLYGKLGVNSKRQAVARGRELGLLEAQAVSAGPQVSVAGGGPGMVRVAGTVSGVGGQMRLELEGLAAMVPPGYMLVLVMPTTLAMTPGAKQETR